jgi:serine/threonine protein kinase
MLALVPPFFTSNLLLLATKICAGEYDRTPLNQYSSRIQEIVTECLVVDPRHRPDICVVAQLCTEELMTYTDRSCNTIQALEKRLRQRETNRESSLLKQHQQHHPRCSSCSSLKESFAGNSGGIADMTFDGADGSHEMFTPGTQRDVLP